MTQSYKAYLALEILRGGIKEISTVNTWAKKLGITTRWLSELMKRETRWSPKELLRMRRYVAIRECIKKDPQMIGYAIALECGLNDEQALFKFLSTHFNTGLKDLRREIWNDIKNKKVGA